ncbi:kinesin-like protein KIF3B, partial [Saccoglossus kowalevskii]
EKHRLLSETQAKQIQLKEQQQARDTLATKIKAMESKLLVGGKSIVDHTNEQQKRLEQHRLEIAEQKRKEREMEQQLMTKDEAQLERKDTYTSLQQEVEIKTKKLKK